MKTKAIAEATKKILYHFRSTADFEAKVSRETGILRRGHGGQIAMKKVSFLWVIVAPVIAWGLTLVFGTGAWWESARLDLDTVRTVLEIREKMNGTLKEILTMDRNETDLLQAKIEYFNAAEKSLARLEGRPPRFYGLKPPVIKLS